MTRLEAVTLFALALGCGSPSYTGTFQGGVFSELDPAPGFGPPPAYEVTVTLEQNGDAVTGTFRATQTNGSSPAITGHIEGTVADKNALEPFVLTLDQLSPDCTPPAFTARGTASLFDDQDAGTLRLLFDASGDSTCGGHATHVTLTASPGLKRQ